jgi:hypothetical protein
VSSDPETSAIIETDVTMIPELQQMVSIGIHIWLQEADTG